MTAEIGAPQSAMLFAAGLGTRMRPLTNDRPKALVELAGKTLLDHMVERVAQVGVRFIIINGYHFAEVLEDFIGERMSNWNANGLKVTLVREDNRAEPLETEGGLINALPYLKDGPILTANCDAVWLDDDAISGLIDFYDPAKMDGALLLADMANVSGFDGAGDFFANEEGQIERRGERPSAPYAYAGVQITQKSLFMGKSVGVRSLNRTWFEEWGPKGRLYGHPLEGPWLHVGDPKALADAEAFLAAQN